MKAIIRSKWFWKVWVPLCFSSVIAGVVILIASRQGERFSISIFDEICTGVIPTLSLVGIGMIALPLILSYLIVSKERKYSKEIKEV